MKGDIFMGGYVKIKASEIPFYISLAEDGIKKYKELGGTSHSAMKAYAMIEGMLIKVKDRDIYIDVDSFDLLEEENK